MMGRVSTPLALTTPGSVLSLLVPRGLGVYMRGWVEHKPKLSIC